MVVIEDVLPHRKPFLFVDEILEVVPNRSAVGYHLVMEEEFWVQGHFPGNPTYPGVLLIETMAQVGGFIFVNEDNKSERYAYLSKVDNFKFVRKVLIGDKIQIKAELVRKVLNYAEVKVEAKVNGKNVASGHIVYTFLEKL